MSPQLMKNIRRAALLPAATAAMFLDPAAPRATISHDCIAGTDEVLFWSMGFEGWECTDDANALSDLEADMPGRCQQYCIECNGARLLPSGSVMQISVHDPGSLGAQRQGCFIDDWAVKFDGTCYCDYQGSYNPGQPEYTCTPWDGNRRPGEECGSDWECCDGLGCYYGVCAGTVNT
jgi:hypothetical protein